LKLIQRIGYYLGGFSLGLIILAFFFNGKKTSCAYGPEARVLKNINTKTLVYSDNIKTILKENSIDSISIREALKLGDINFYESDTRKEPCGIYAIESTINDREIMLTVENCETIATLQNIKW